MEHLDHAVTGHLHLAEAAALSWPVAMGPILAGLFLTGLAGGFGHCAPMCGPFVLAQAPGGAGGPRLARLGGALLLPYHLGRMTTYVALGALAGGVSGMIAGAAPFRWILAAFLLAAALLFACRGAAGLGRWLPRGPRLPAWGRGLGLAVARLARPLFREPRGWNGYALGLALGFLPCGLLYAALAAAAGIGDAIGGGLAMLAFALGTLPALFAVGLAGAAAGRCWAGFARLAAPPLMLANAALLGVTAWHALG